MPFKGSSAIRSLADCAERAEHCAETDVNRIDLLHGDVTGQILNAYYEIYHDLGYGFQENVYSDVLAIELGLRGRNVAREAPTQIHWKGRAVGTYRIDVLVDGCVIVEVKSVESIAVAHERQVMNYLRATNIEVGMLLNFGPAKGHRRIVYSNSRKSFSNG
jgi:GxxExxY protein